MSRLRTVLSAQTQTVSVSGCPAEVVPPLESSIYFDKGIQYAFRFDAFSLPSLMHQRWDSVFGGISFFSQLRFLITFMDGCQNQDWFSLTPELNKVRSSHCFRHNSVWPGSPICQFLQAISTYKLEIPRLPTYCSELLTNGKPVLEYMTKIAPPQAMQRINKGSILSNFCVHFICY